MKIKILSIILLTTLFFSCSVEEKSEIQSNDAQSTELGTSGEVILSKNSRGERFECDPQWVPPVAPVGSHGVLYTINYSQDPNDYPNGVIDVACAREELFSIICNLHMLQLQNTDPFIDTWLQDTVPCTGGKEDDVNTAVQSDPRVCIGSACGD
ncbi:MAG: hypothetical protein AAFP76_08825 [Bacteroidota bacterium]